MSLYDRGEFKLEDPVVKFLPAFSQDARREITIKQLLTHTSGLPDQLPENDSLRRRHAPLEDFVQRAMQTPLLFAPGSRYSYSSMGILLASEIAHTITAQTFSQFVRSQIFEPLAMDRTALGLGELQLEETMQCQVEHAAREAGAGDPSTLDWDWNSAYWRNLGAPWGGVHASAADVSKFLRSFLNNSGQCLKPETATLMITNHNDPRFAPRGLGFALGSAAHSPHCSEAVFGHSGSTGTLCWADPATDTVCVVLTTLPAAAGKVHPRQLAADYIARSVV
jgi:CubicO group peptidase (beta-lactamase class C family)